MGVSQSSVALCGCEVECSVLVFRLEFSGKEHLGQGVTGRPNGDTQDAVPNVGVGVKFGHGIAEETLKEGGHGETPSLAPRPLTMTLSCSADLQKPKVPEGPKWQCETKLGHNHPPASTGDINPPPFTARDTRLRSDFQRFKASSVR